MIWQTQTKQGKVLQLCLGQGLFCRGPQNSITVSPKVYHGLTNNANRVESRLSKKVYVAHTTPLIMQELGCGVREQAGKIHWKIKFV